MWRFLLLRLEAPLQAWGDVAIDTRRPTLQFPTRSGLAGLLASALGWRYREAARTTRLQDGLRIAIRQDRAPRRLRDYQTVDLGRETSGWTRWGVEKRGGAFATGTHILTKHYLADASFLVALRLCDVEVSVDELESALAQPARPLFLGRKSCLPAEPILQGHVDAPSGYDALRLAPLTSRHDPPPFRCWLEPGDGPTSGHAWSGTVWDRRDFVADRFAGQRTILQSTVTLAEATVEDGQ